MFKGKHEPSYVLFSKYIERDDQGNIDATKILSKECYEAWLESREIFPRLPEESFRKALTSHCKGAAGMKPFAPEAEKAVLELLRERRVWPCFEGTDVKIGIRGCNLKGYWESMESTEKRDEEIQHHKHKQQIGVSSIDPVSGNSTGKKGKNGVKSESEGEFNLKKRRVPGEVSGSGFIGDDDQARAPPEPLNIKFNSSKMFSHNETIYGRDSDPDLPPDYVPPDVNIDLSNLNIKESDDPVIEAQHPEPEDFLEIFTSISKFANEHPDKQEWESAPDEQKVMMILDKFSKAMSYKGVVRNSLKAVFEYLPKKHLLMFILTLYRQTGFTTLFPKYSDLSEEELDSSVKFFLSREFCIPPESERCFKRNRPIGVCLGDFANYTIVDADEACEKIYRGSIVGVHSIKTRVHKFQGVLYLHEQLSEIFANGESWTRSIEYRCDGTIMVLLNRYVMYEKRSNCVRVEHQDITDDYAHLL